MSKLPFVEGVLTQVESVARRMQRLRVEGQEIARLTYVPGQHVRVLVADVRDPRNWLRPKDFLRTYSVWRHDEGLELCVLDHGDAGPGTRWVRELRVGQRVSFLRPEGSFTLREAPYHLFAGEETAAVAFGAMMRSVPVCVPVHGVLEVDEPGDRLELDRFVSWRYRHGRSAAASESLLAAVSELDLPATPGTAYLAGEARTIQMLRRHLVTERGWPREAIRTKPFWAPGKRGLD